MANVDSLRAKLFELQGPANILGFFKGTHDDPTERLLGNHVNNRDGLLDRTAFAEELLEHIKVERERYSGDIESVTSSGIVEIRLRNADDEF